MDRNRPPLFSLSKIKRSSAARCSGSLVSYSIQRPATVFRIRSLCFSRSSRTRKRTKVLWKKSNRQPAGRSSHPFPRSIRHKKRASTCQTTAAVLRIASCRRGSLRSSMRPAGHANCSDARTVLPFQMQIRAVEAFVVDRTRHEAKFAPQSELRHKPEISVPQPIETDRNRFSNKPDVEASAEPRSDPRNGTQSGFSR